LLAFDTSVTMRCLQIVATLGTAVATTPNVMYFRSHNMDRSSPLAVSTTAASVTLNEWDTAINNFDSPKDVTVQRLDITGSPSETVSLYSKTSPLQFSDGPVYIFHNSTQLIMEDLEGKNYSAPKTETIVWIAQASCLQLHVTLSPEGEASLMAVTSGKVQWAATQATSSTCGTSNVLIGGGLPARSGSGGSNIYNEVKYSLTNSDTCSDPLEHGTNGYSQTDMRIGPLNAHFHTRGTLYYNQFGTSKYNDEAAPNDVLYQSELRFVNAGVLYGPEEMDRTTAWVSSVHEADPAAIDPIGESPTTECPFACMTNSVPSAGSIARCTKSSANVVQV